MPPTITNTQDLNQLRLLSIFYYILAAMSGLAGCCLIGYGVFMVGMLAGLEGPELPPVIGGYIIAIVIGLFTFIIWTMAILEILAGRSLGRHSYYRFCFAMACIELINFPFGTTLAVLTIVVLSRPSVKAIYEGRTDDSRLAALDEFDEGGVGETEPHPAPPKNAGDDSIKEA